MLAAVLKDVDVLELEDVPAPEPGPGEVVVRNVLLKDPEYVERIKRHYKMFRDKVDQPRILRRSRKPIRPPKRKPTKRRR